MKGVPRIAAGVVMTAIDSDQGLTYRLRSPARGAGTILQPRSALPLMLMDGKRTLAEVHQGTLAHGIKMPDPSKFLGLISVLEAAGIVEVAHHYDTPGPLRHRCEGCGQSCEGHLVGPIDAAEGKLLEQRLAELRADDPTIQDGPAVVEVQYGGQLQPVLNFIDGACIFLTEDKRCRLHGRWGATSKPLPCRMFPFRMVRSETGTRVTISPRCFRAHHSYETAPPIAADTLLDEWGVWRPPSLVQGLDPVHDETLLPTPASEVNRTHETAALAMLEDTTQPFDLAALLASLRAWVSDPGSPTAPSPAPPAPGLAAKIRFGRSVLAVQRLVFERHFDVGNVPRPSRFGLSMTALIRGVMGLDEAQLPDWWDLPEPAARYVRHCLRHLIFAREVMAFGSVRGGILALSMGTMAARWLTQRAALEAGELDAFVQHQTAWLRLSGSPELQAVAFPQPDGPDALLGLLWTSWS